MTERNDHDLRDRFAALRREDANHATPFETMLARARARRTGPPRRVVLGLVAIAAVLAAVGLAILLPRRHRDGAPIDLATVHWQAPTDFLLELPGAELLRTVPELGRMSLPRADLTPQDSDRRTP
jgi:hypothetical protein